MKHLKLNEDVVIDDIMTFLQECDADELAGLYGHIFGMDGSTEGTGEFDFTPGACYAGQRENELVEVIEE